MPLFRNTVLVIINPFIDMFSTSSDGRRQLLVENIMRQESCNLKNFFKNKSDSAASDVFSLFPLFYNLVLIILSNISFLFFLVSVFAPSFTGTVFGGGSSSLIP
jgi:hypothetical protein